MFWSWPMILTELAPLTPESASSILSWIYWEKLKVTPGQLFGKLLLELVDQHVLGVASRPFVVRLERREQLDIGERRSIAAVVGPAVLGNDVQHFRMTKQDLAHLRRRRLARLQSHRRRHRCPDPQIAFFQCRQKLAAKPCRQEADTTRNKMPIASMVFR